MSKKNGKKKSRLYLKLICNPGSGDGKDITGRLEQAVRWLKERNLKVDVALAHPKEKATPIAKAAAQDGYDIVVAMGGDGTIEAVARGLVGTKTYLGILPIGTFNNVARSLGVPEDLEQACALLARGKGRRMDIGQIKCKKKGKFYFIEVAAIGLTAALYPKGKDIAKGKLANIANVVSTLIRYKVPKIYLTMDGESYVKEKSLLATVSNAPAFGPNFLVAPYASLEDGLLDVSLYPNFTKPELIAYFAQVAKAGFSEDGRIQRYRVHKLKIKARPDLRVMADGVMLGEGTVKISVKPGALRVIAPPAGTGLAQEAPPQKQQLPTPAAPAPTNNPPPEAAQPDAQTAPQETQKELVADSQSGSKNGAVPVSGKEGASPSKS